MRAKQRRLERKGHSPRIDPNEFVNIVASSIDKFERAFKILALENDEEHLIIERKSFDLTINV